VDIYGSTLTTTIQAIKPPALPVVSCIHTIWGLKVHDCKCTIHIMFISRTWVCLLIWVQRLTRRVFPLLSYSSRQASLKVPLSQLNRRPRSPCWRW